eukprot:Hpha_TRINITY_DN20411_c0_g1::TRINITY_DN20411_c0_g1_i1::g.64175::m.64175/K03424/tatD; TatD DNase family protein
MLPRAAGESGELLLAARSCCFGPRRSFVAPAVRPLYDAHCHLPSGAPQADLAQLTSRYAALQLRGLCLCAVSEPDWDSVIAVASKLPASYACVGLHPWAVDHRRSGWEGRLEEFLRRHPGVGVGEFGLDKCRGEDYEAQLHCFEAQLGLAASLGRIAVVHCVRAIGDLVDGIRAQSSRPEGLPRALYLHAWAGSADATRQIVKLLTPSKRSGSKATPVYFGFSVSSLKKNWKESLKAAPPETILLESDASVPEAQPQLLGEMLGSMAETMGLTEEATIELMETNARRAFELN